MPFYTVLANKTHARMHTYPLRRSQFFLHQASGNDQLAGPVDQTLKVLEVTGQAYVAENCLFQLSVQHVKVAVHANARLLMLHVAMFGLKPVHIALIPFHVCQQGIHVRRRELAVLLCARLCLELDAGLDDVIVAYVDFTHACV